jgi:hypothetical protein
MCAFDRVADDGPDHERVKEAVGTRYVVAAMRSGGEDFEVHGARGRPASVSSLGALVQRPMRVRRRRGRVNLPSVPLPSRVAPVLEPTLSTA